MKKQLLFVSLMAVLSLTVCKHATEPVVPDMVVNIEVDSAFQDDFVRVVLDGKTLLESKVTTNYTVSLAWSSGLRKMTRDRHVLHFEVVEYAVQRNYTIDASNDTSTVVLLFDKNTKKIGIQQVKGLLLRL
jgi:hypothetical protein